ncbi:MAG: 50S ribosomal protein L25 [Clostridia bacterium]|nr:50S ribosomal protein L25 [Clostridia bacterium]
MEDIILNAYERPSKKFKEMGFIPGVIYGDSMKETTPVKFKFQALQKVINQHGEHAKIWVMLNGEKKFGFIKEVQKHPVSRILQHIDVQAVSKDHEVKMQVPIVFQGEEALNSKQLQLQVQKTIVEVVGKVGDIPDNIVINVSEMDASDSINTDNLNLNENIRIVNEDEVYASIVHPTLRTEEEETPAAEGAEQAEGVEENKEEE